MCRVVVAVRAVRRDVYRATARRRPCMRLRQPRSVFLVPYLTTINTTRISRLAERARLLSSGARGASGWLRAIPSSYHTQVTNVEMRMSMQLWLGSVIPALIVTPPICGCARTRTTGPDGSPGLADIRGRHEFCCTLTSSEKLRRHNHIIRAFQSAIELLQIQSTSSSVLRLARRTLLDGTPDPTDRSQHQPDLAIYDYHPNYRINRCIAVGKC